MWETMSNMMPDMGRMMPKRRRRGMNTTTAMLIGAGIGIATWEMVRRNNVTGQIMGNQTGSMDSTSISDATITQMADQVMDAIK